MTTENGSPEGGFVELCLFFIWGKVWCWFKKNRGALLVQGGKVKKRIMPPPNFKAKPCSGGCWGVDKVQKR